MGMEKSSKIILNQLELELYNQGFLADSLKSKYGILSYEELKKVIDVGEYEISSSQAS